MSRSKKNQTESSEDNKTKKTKRVSKKESKKDNPDEEIIEDELSSVEIDETGKEGVDVKETRMPPREDTPKVPNKFREEVLPPKGIPWEELDVIDHLNCIIKFAGDTYNQQLRSDALNIKLGITGNGNKRRRNRSNSKTQNFPRENNNFGPRENNNFGPRPDFRRNNQQFTDPMSSRGPPRMESVRPPPRNFRPRSNSLSQRRPPMMESPDIYND